MIDCHLLTDGDVPQSDEFVTYHKVAPIDGDLFSARAYAFQIGDAPRVSFADPGDWILPGAFEALAAVDKPAVCTNSVVVGTRGMGRLLRGIGSQWSVDRHVRSPYDVHQLIAVERDLMKRAIDAADKTPDDLKNISPNQLIFAHVALLAGWSFIDCIGYVWFDQPDSFHRGITREQRREFNLFFRNLFGR